jgi:hypothetical protein
VNDRYEVVLLDFNMGTSRVIYASPQIPVILEHGPQEAGALGGQLAKSHELLRTGGLCLKQTREATLVGVPAASPGLCNTYCTYRARHEHHISWEMQSGGEDVIGSGSS